MEPGTAIAIGSLLVAAIAVLINFVKWRREEKDKDESELGTTIRSEIEKSSLSITGAQGAVELMQRMLDVAATSESKLQIKVTQQAIRIEALEAENETQRKCIREQNHKIEDQQRQIAALETRLANLENKEQS